MSTKKQEVLPKRKCLRCGHEWVGRIKESRVCPGCRSPYWDTPKKTKAE